MTIAQKCIVDNCINKMPQNKNGNYTSLKGMCIMHYERYKRNGHTDLIIDRHYKSHSEEYKIWSAMKDRCNNRNNKQFHRYGGRGIKVCDRWEDSFLSFYFDMGKKPSKDYSLDRINNDEGYSPENCRWATRQVQALNKSHLNIGRAVKPLKYTSVPDGKIAGVIYSKKSKRWRAYINVKNKRYDITVSTKLEAYNYRKAFELMAELTSSGLL